MKIFTVEIKTCLDCPSLIYPVGEKGGYMPYRCLPLGIILENIHKTHKDCPLPDKPGAAEPTP